MTLGFGQIAFLAIAALTVAAALAMVLARHIFHAIC